MSFLSFDITITKHGRGLVQVKNFRIEENHITFLFGESGIGKSLIAKAIYGLLSPEEFNVTINGELYDRYISQNQTKEIQQNSFFVFQEPSSHLNPLLTLGSQLQEGDITKTLRNTTILQRLWDTDVKEVIQKILAIYPKPYRPSGGEKQRLLLAMAFLKIESFQEEMTDLLKTLFVFDEPSGSLDNYFRDVFLSFLFEKYQKRKFTVLLITHDYSIISAVNSANSKIHSDISYKELAVGQKGLKVDDFVPDHYLNWLKSKERLQVSVEQNGGKRTFLHVESDIVAFERRLVISKDKEGQSTCPLEIKPFTMVYLKAPSGVGKTTFAKSIMGLVRAQHFHMTLKDFTLSEQTSKRFWQTHIWGKQMAITFQHADEALNQNSTIKGTLSGLPATRITTEDIQQMMKELFDVGIDDRFLNRKVKYLSGGQKQKLNLMRSFVLNTDILILDEPLNGLDFESIKKVLSMLQAKQKAGKGILLISHNEEIFDAIIPKGSIYYLHAYPLI